MSSVPPQMALTVLKSAAVLLLSKRSVRVSRYFYVIFFLYDMLPMLFATLSLDSTSATLTLLVSVELTDNSISCVVPQSTSLQSVYIPVVRVPNTLFFFPLAALLSRSHTRCSKLMKVFTLLFLQPNSIHTLTHTHTQARVFLLRLHVLANRAASSVFHTESISTNSSTPVTTHTHRKQYTHTKHQMFKNR